MREVTGEDFENQVTRVAALSDPIRRSLYLSVAKSAEAISREQAAAAAGVQKALATFHLEKLVEKGLLDVEFRRLNGRSGPGAGRPAKLYRRSDRHVDVSLPHREYDLVGTLLASAIDAAERTGRSVRDELERSSSDVGRAMGEQAAARAGRRAPKRARREALLDVLRDHGFEPRAVGRDVVLANCPFHVLSQQFTELVCSMNLRLLEGIRSAFDLETEDLRPRLEPQPGQCCVKFCTTA